MFTILLPGHAGAVSETILDEKHCTRTRGVNRGANRHDEIVSMSNERSRGMGAIRAVGLVNDERLTDGIR